MYDTIKIEKGLYGISGKTFTQALAELDPDDAYAGTDMEGLDAFERQLKRFDIKVKGTDCDRVEKFFTSTESAVLFPEFVRRNIKLGMEKASILPKIVAAVSYTDAMDFRGLSVESAGTAAGVAQGGEIPTTTVKLASSASELTKFARKLSCTYESIRKQRLEAFAVVLRNLGADISRALNKAACDALSASITASEISGSSITYTELAAFWASLTDGEMDTIITTPAAAAAIVAFDEMKCCTPVSGNASEIKTPFGVTIVKCSGVAEKTAIGIDSTAALEMICSTDVIVDYDKLISTQCDEISASIMAGFSKISASAAKVTKTAQ